MDYSNSVADSESPLYHGKPLLVPLINNTNSCFCYARINITIGFFTDGKSVPTVSTLK